MVQANITSYIGLDTEAEHYYCHYSIIDEMVNPSHTYTKSVYCSEELEHELTEYEAIRLTKKDNGYRWKVGSKTNRFESIRVIHEYLLKLFPNETIVTYYEDKLFKGMLYFKNGVNLGYESFGDVWINCPSSCWTDLLPKEKKSIKIKCDTCGKEYSLDEVSYETEYFDNGEKRKITNFYKKQKLKNETGEDLCCKYFDLIWNVIL